MLSMWASWPIDKHVKAYCILFLLLETGMLGVFLALDFFLFYVFWEVMLLPMYFLIGVWGGPRREYAAIKFFLYTLVGSVFMLIAILMLYFNSDLKLLCRRATGRGQRRRRRPHGRGAGRQDRRNPRPDRAAHTFNIVALQEMGQHTTAFDGKLLWGKNLQWWAFLLLLVGFVIKVPSVPLHTWLPDAHVEAPTPISMILAGVLLKMGGYGIIRICYPICPDAGYDLAYFVCGLGVVSMVYGGVRGPGPEGLQAARGLQLRQPHGLRRAGHRRVERRGRQSVQSRLLADGHERRHVPDDRPRHQLAWHVLHGRRRLRAGPPPQPRPLRRLVRQDAGLLAAWRSASSSPASACRACAGSSAKCSSPSRVWNYSTVLAVISASVVIITAAYILWTIQRVYLGPEYKGPHAEDFTR